MIPNLNRDQRNAFDRIRRIVDDSVLIDGCLINQQQQSIFLEGPGNIDYMYIYIYKCYMNLNF